MTETADPTEEIPAKKSKMPMILGLILALVGGGGGFFIVSSGLLGGSEPAAEEQEEVEEPLDTASIDIAFVPLEPLIVSLGSGSQKQHLRFKAQLEVPTKYQSDVEGILPRIIDVLNSYLRALRAEDIEKPDALVRLRAQMLRRIQIVTGKGRVRDLLVMEFVLN